ncbi:MAG TPA: alkaline phosphatase family protein [Candidatus Limnocylindrales bacterium]|nr:alkaline phosphatase family protein [Candidatus Limnocylindrales bacterium]
MTVPTRSNSPRQPLHRMLVTFATAVLVAGSLAIAPAASAAPPGPAGPPTGSCDLQSKGDKIQHVIYLQFDNVHFERDNPNVPSDLEQMPHLLDFLKDNGTFDTNDHTILISHTGGGILSSLTGLYPDRHGQAVSNSYGYFRPDGSVGFSSSFKYWTDNTDGGNPANTPPTASADTNFNMVNADPASLGGSGSVRNAPAPWVPYTRAGCDVGNVGVANTVLENNTAIAFRNTPAPTKLSVAAAVGDTNIKVDSVDGLAAGQTLVIDNGNASNELATIANVGTAGGGGTGVDLTAPLAKAHTAGAQVNVTATDPTGDMTKVFGADTPEWVEGRASQISPSGTAARNLAQTDFVGIAIHCAAGGGICNDNAANARPDPLPDESGGYTGYQALFGAKYVNPAINDGNGCVNGIEGQPIQDQFNQCGFPGFDGMFARNTLGEVAAMQEAGVPVTFGYISDAHDGHGVAGEIHHAYGPGEAGYVQQLHDYDQAFGDFFTRLQNDGITKDNTLFVVTVEESDHFAGTQPDAPCDGVTTACTYANVSEVNADLKRLVATYNANHGTTATTNFSVHSDLAPNVYITGAPAAGSPTARTLEQAMSDMNVTNPYTGVQQKLFVAMADPVEQKLLHMSTADPARLPTFTPFAQGDFFLTASSTTPCPGNDPNACLTTAITNPNQTFAWNHGGIQPEIRSTWIGWVGPGVVTQGQTDAVWTDHTDIRPTMLALLGLHDDYVSDGRVVTQFLKPEVTPTFLNGRPDVESLGAMWKQINASFGQFSMDTLCASTGALASTSLGDSTYTNTENALATLGTQRDGLADQIRLALWNAEFANKKIDPAKTKAWISQGQGYLDQAAALCGRFSSSPANARELDKINHIVVVYEENHSFDNLYGGWEGVNGLANADEAHTTQVNEAGNSYTCLKQDDVNLQDATRFPQTCADATPGTPGGPFTSAFPNAPFTIDDYIAPADTTCPPNPPVAFSQPNGWLNGTGSAGGCTRDLVHRFYHEQYQLDGGAQDRYVTGSDAMGLSMGVYDTKALPIYQYLHSAGHPSYAIEDNFFQSAFGGSFLNHQWLIAAASPVDPGGASGGANATRHPVLDANGMPSNEPLYTSTITPTGTPPSIPPDRELTATCAQVATLAPPLNGLACGNYGVNTMQPAFQPSGLFGAKLPAQTAPTIGDRLTGAGVDWAWYSGGWDNANGNTSGPGYTNGSSASNTPTGCSDPNVDPGVSHWPECPDNLFQYHHQPFNYFANFSTATTAGQANRDAHLLDEVVFEQAVGSSSGTCDLKPVSFVKPIGEENEHPGYASEPGGSDHLVDLISSIEGSACAADTMIIVAYDEFGGQWDHVSPPGQGNDNGPHDIWGPGTRIASLVIAPDLKAPFVVDSTEHDTTSILSTIEHRFGLVPLETRDAAANDLSTVFNAKKAKS